MLTRMVIGLACILFVQNDAPPQKHIPPSTVDPPPSELPLPPSRSEVREIIRPKCGSCHTSSLPTANPRAVAVFDLAKDEWPAGMSPKQLEKFNSRLSSLDDSLKSKIDAFVNDEIARRKASGS